MPPEPQPCEGASRNAALVRRISGHFVPQQKRQIMHLIALKRFGAAAILVSAFVAYVNVLQMVAG
jgi:hypothetical protein